MYDVTKIWMYKKALFWTINCNHPKAHEKTKAKRSEKSMKISERKQPSKIQMIKTFGHETPSSVENTSNLRIWTVWWWRLTSKRFVYLCFGRLLSLIELYGFFRYALLGFFRLNACKNKTFLRIPVLVTSNNILNISLDMRMAPINIVCWRI